MTLVTALTQAREVLCRAQLMGNSRGTGGPRLRVTHRASLQVTVPGVCDFHAGRGEGWAMQKWILNCGASVSEKWSLCASFRTALGGIETRVSRRQSLCPFPKSFAAQEQGQEGQAGFIKAGW